MEMEYKQTITLTPEMVKEIIGNHVAKTFNLSGTVKVTLEAGLVYEDRMACTDRGTPKFKQATVEVVTKGKI